MLAVGISCAVLERRDLESNLARAFPDGHAVAIHAALDRYCGLAADHVGRRPTELAGTSGP